MKTNMQIILTRLILGERKQTKLGDLPHICGRSLSRAREELSAYADKELSKGWRFIPREGHMINFFIKDHNGDQISVESDVYRMNAF